jgi:hypothetical protein
LAPQSWALSLAAYWLPCIYIVLGGFNMTKNEFMQLCAAACIDPAVALENDNVIDAIRAGDARLVQFLLDNEF